MRLWIDTDVGDNPDDAVALLAAAGHPAVQLAGVSVVGADAPRRVALARSLVPAPVFDGRDSQQLLDAIAVSEAEAILAIGPLTNVVRLLPLGAGLPRLVVMGGALGAVQHRGGVRRVESNFAADPLAASAVVAGAAPTIVPLDVTAQLALDPGRLDRLVAARADLGAPIMAWLERLEADGVARPDRRLVLHDPLALLAALGDPCVAVESRYLVVDPATGELQERSRGTRCEVVTKVDVRAALATILALVEAA